MANNKVVFGQEVLIDLTQDTVTPYALEEGYTAHAPSGEKIVGVMKPNKPVEVETNAEMTAISAGATEKDLGNVYLFVGEDDSVFEKDALYILVKKGAGYGFQRYAIGGFGDNTVVDVDALPTENIDQSKIYRVKGETEPSVYIIWADNVRPRKTTFEEYMANDGLIFSATYYEVGSLPETPEQTTFVENKITAFVYILKSTGTAYLSQDGAEYVPMATVEIVCNSSFARDHGWITKAEFDAISLEGTYDDLLSIVGLYSIRGETSTTYGIPDEANNKTVYEHTSSTGWKELGAGGGEGSGGTCAGGIIDVTELPAGYKDVDVYARFDESTYMTFLQLLQSKGLNPGITYYVVDELPATGNVTDFNTLSVIYIYIANNIPYVYGDLGSGGMWVTVSAMLADAIGTPMPDKGFTSDITAETEVGVYVTYKEGEKPVEGVVYRLTTETEPALWTISDGQKMNYGKMMEADGATLVYHIVEALPDTMEPINSESMTVHFYVLNGTGIGYVSPDGTLAFPLSQCFFDQAGFDKGWATDIDSIDATVAENMGVYFVRGETFITYNVYSGGEWTDYIDGESARFKIEGLNGEIETLENDKTALETENETLNQANATLEAEITTLEGKVEEKTSSANFTDYGIIIASQKTGGVMVLTASGFTNTEITSVTIPSFIDQISTGAFDECANLEKVVINDGAYRIHERAFYDCVRLKNVTIPTSMTQIDSRLFQIYSSYVQELVINYTGTKEQWKAIVKAGDWDNGTPNYTIYCTDGTIAKDGTET